MIEKGNDKLVEAVPDDGDDMFRDPEREAVMQKAFNLMPLPSVSGDFEDRVEVLYDQASEPEGDLEELETEENLEILERTKIGVQKVYNAYWQLARDLYLVSSNRLYKVKALGYTTFDSYVAEELNFTARKAHDLISIYRYYSKDLKNKLADQPETYKEIVEKVKEIGWTKAKTIAGKNILDANNAKELFTKFTAPDTSGNVPSVSKIEEMVNQEYHSRTAENRLEVDEGNSIENVSMRFTWSKVQANHVVEALGIAKSICSENTKPSSHMAWICGEFVTNYALDHGKDVDIKDVIPRFEDALEADIIVVDRHSGVVRYGKETAEALKKKP